MYFITFFILGLLGIAGLIAYPIVCILAGLSYDLVAGLLLTLITITTWKEIKHVADKDEEDQSTQGFRVTLLKSINEFIRKF